MNCSIQQEEARLRAEAAALYAHYEQVVSGLHEMDGEGARAALDILNEAQMAEMCADGLAEEQYASCAISAILGAAQFADAMRCATPSQLMSAHDVDFALGEDDDAEDMGDYEGRQAECDLADALDDLPF
tara:strand:- start:184 stop:573 length:390 start_codon:yes stop_codon:yes gene_type:complete